jgi:hypothetical protein
MADGMRCRYCGFQETDHELGGELGDKSTADELLPGRKFTLAQCLEKHGFVPENPELAKELQQKADQDAAEQSMRKRKLAVFGERDYDD